MNCSNMEQLVLLKDSGEISRDQEQELMMHVEVCSECRKATDDLGLLRNTYIAATLALPGPSQEAIGRILKAAKGRPSAATWLWSHPKTVALAAAASLIFCLTSTYVSKAPSLIKPIASAHNINATEIIPLIAMITGTEPSLLTMEGEESELAVMASELLRLQDMNMEGTADRIDEAILSEDYQPTTLLWNNTPVPLSGIYG